MIRPFILMAFMPLAALAQPGLILHNGKIVTVDGSFSIAQAVAVEDGRISAVGANAEVLKLRGAATRVVDLGGRTVLPGLIDSHVHVLDAGLSEFREKLPRFDSFRAIQNYIAEQAKTTPKGDWIVVPRTFPTRLAEMRMPTREVLDVAKDHPVMFDASYVVVANSKALEVSGITRDTPDPPGGEIVRDAKGEPNGILKNAQKLLKGAGRTAKPFTAAERAQALEEMLKRYPAAGLTSVGDRAVTPEEINLYDQLRKRGPLPVRVSLTWRMPTTAPTEELVRTIESAPYRADSTDDWLRFVVFKVTLDGGMTIGTAYQRAPYGPFGAQLYGKTSREDRGQLFIPPDKLERIFEAALAKGWAVTAHAQGGGAIDAFLDALEKINARRPVASSRSHLMHASFQSPEAIRRAVKLGLLADVQPAWLWLDGPALEKVFTDEGMKYFFPLRTYIDDGMKLAGGSDHMTGHGKNNSVNPYNPFLGMWTAVTRLTAEGKVLRPEQRIGRPEALRAYTIWAAALQRAEDAKGSIEKGKYADLVVIDRDYLTCPEDDIRRIEPVATILDGKIAYGKL